MKNGVDPLRVRRACGWLRHSGAMAGLALHALCAAGPVLAQPLEARVPARFEVVKVNGSATCAIDVPPPPDPAPDLGSARKADVLSGRPNLAAACGALRDTTPQDCPVLDAESVEACMSVARIQIPHRWAAMRSPPDELLDLVPTAGWRNPFPAFRWPGWLAPRAQQGGSATPSGEASGAVSLSHVRDCLKSGSVALEPIASDWAKLPFVLRMVGGAKVCGATQLSRNELLTAAHCLPDGWRTSGSLQLTLIQGGTPTLHTLKCSDYRPPWNATVVCRSDQDLPCPSSGAPCHVSGVADGGTPMPSGALLVLGWDRERKRKPKPQAYCVGPGSALPFNMVTRACHGPPHTDNAVDQRGSLSLRCPTGRSAPTKVYVAEQGDSGLPVFATCGLPTGASALLIEGVNQRVTGAGSHPDTMPFTDFRCPEAPAVTQ